MLQAMFLAWHDEEKRRIGAETRAHELEKNEIPDLRGEIDWAVHAQPDDWPSLAVHVRVINLGAPTVIENWELRIKLRFDETLVLTPFFQAEDLQTKSKKLLHRGETLDGQMTYRLSDPAGWDGDEDAIEKIEVGFRDFLKRTYTARSPVKPVLS